jgi:hypothetical protein
MWAFGVIMDAPLLNDHLCFLEAVRAFTIQTIILEFLSVVPTPCGACLQGNENDRTKVWDECLNDEIFYSLR